MIVRTESDLRQALSAPTETEHLEFKEAKNSYGFDDLSDYCCALANEGGGSIVLGVTDQTPTHRWHQSVPRH
ncbi:MAG: helix-turn-helix domain-containing protein [Micropepsaceae bacterium]